MQTEVWSRYTRLFHLLVVLGFVIAYISAEDDVAWLFSLHILAGSLVLGLMVLRIPWGWMGVRYSRFRDFELTLPALKHYFLTFFSHKPSLGHNPASSFSAVGLILLGIITPLLGFVLLGAKEGEGILSFLYFDYHEQRRFFKELHEIAANLFLLLVLAHIGGVLFEHLYHRSEIIKSMINGNKPMEGEPIRLNFAHHIYGIFWITAAVFFAIYSLFFS